MTRLTEQEVDEIARRIAAEMARGGEKAPPPVSSQEMGLGVFATVSDAVGAAAVAQKEFVALKLAHRSRILEATQNLNGQSCRRRLRFDHGAYRSVADDHGHDVGDGDARHRLQQQVRAFLDAEASDVEDHGLIGFDVMGLADRWGAAFVSAGGYHHHLGLNTWAGEGAPPAPVDAAGLRHFTIELPDEASLSQVAARLGGAGVPMSESSEGGWLLADPSRNRVHLSVRGA